MLQIIFITNQVEDSEDIWRHLPARDSSTNKYIRKIVMANLID